MKMMRREEIIIEGMKKGGIRFQFSLPIVFDPEKDIIENVIARELDDTCRTFDELQLKNGWTSAHWTYPQINAMAYFS